ncbi:MAG TPA: heme-copper oxidase subunit III [Bryobacteraceae bacterium]|nr:heme-copper oxidase subunit III [Bryobacteraceae bacterium]
MAGLTDDIVHGPPPPGEWGRGGGSSADVPGVRRRASLLGLYLLLISSSMVFLALLAAFVMRRVIAVDWVSMPKPHILWWNTGALVASSALLEKARRQLRAADRVGFNWWWTGATVLGILFLLGQALAWRELRNSGFFIASNPATSFFYILTATHAAHVLGAIAAVVYVDIEALRFTLGPAKRTVIDASAIFWHFLDGMWLCLMALFYIWG